MAKTEVAIDGDHVAAVRDHQSDGLAVQRRDSGALDLRWVPVKASEPSAYHDRSMARFAKPQRREGQNGGARPTSSGSKAFVGRAPELAALHAHLGDVRDGAPRVVVVEGPAGMGKTALLHRFFDTVEGMRVVRASGDEAEAALPYGVVAQVTAGLHDVTEPSARARIDLSAEPLVVGAELLDQIGTLSGREPLAVVVDDGQWADASSLQALTFALRRLQSDPILAIFVVRDGEHALPDGLRRLAGQHSLRLDGLDSHHLAELAAALGVDGVGPQAAERLRQHTGGNPLYARALLEELDPDVLRLPSGRLPAPRSFSSLVLGRLAACGPEGRALLEAAAVLGQPAPLGLAARLAELGDAATALDQAMGTRLLAPSTPGVLPDVVFAHPLVQAAIYHDLGPVRRSVLHGRAAALIDGSASLEHRIAAALVEDPALAAEVEAQGRAEVGAGAHARAAAHLVAAARLSPDLSAREGLVLDAAEVLLRDGSVAEAAALMAQTAGFADSPRRTYLLGRVAFLGGRHADAEALLMDAWRAEESTVDSRLAGPVAAHLAWLFSLQMRLDLVVQWATRAIEAGHVYHREVPVRSLIMTSLGLAGRAEEALALAASIPDQDMGAAASAELVVGRGLVRMWTDDLEAAHADLSAVAASPLLPGMPLVALGWLAEAEFRLGAWDDSVVHANLAVSLVDDTDQVWLGPFVHTMAVWALAARGDWERAQAHVRSAGEGAAVLGDPAGKGYAAVAAAHLAFCRGDPTAVVDALQPIRSLPGWQQVEEPGVLRWAEVYADALVSLGRLREAEEVLDGLEAMAVPRARSSTLARAALARGRLATADNDPDGARRAFLGGLDHAEGLAMPFERALLNEALGRFLRRAGERRNAAVRLRAALEAFTVLGARPFADRCQTELDACGLSRPDRPPSGHAALTPQELAVARLVAKGLPNREVAAELVVSPKTVEYHLGHVFAKLGVRSRTQLALLLGAVGPRNG
jgi:DNA-binding CsgD family transcriptional regulator